MKVDVKFNKEQFAESIDKAKHAYNQLMESIDENPNWWARTLWKIFVWLIVVGFVVFVVVGYVALKLLSYIVTATMWVFAITIATYLTLTLLLPSVGIDLIAVLAPLL